MGRDKSFEEMVGAIRSRDLKEDFSYKNFSLHLSDHFAPLLKSKYDLDKEGGESYEAFNNYSGQIVFDLGSGVNPATSYSFLNSFGIKGYVGVELFNFELGRRNLEVYLKKKGKKSFPPFHMADSDIRNILRKLPVASSSFVATGIDSWVIENSDYFKECDSLIQEKLHPKGVFVSLCSNFFRTNKEFSDLDIVRDGSLTLVTKKIKP